MLFISSGYVSKTVLLFFKISGEQYGEGPRKKSRGLKWCTQYLMHAESNLETYLKVWENKSKLKCVCNLNPDGFKAFNNLFF